LDPTGCQAMRVVPLAGAALVWLAWHILKQARSAVNRKRVKIAMHGAYSWAGIAFVNPSSGANCLQATGGLNIGNYWSTLYPSMLSYERG